MCHPAATATREVNLSNLKKFGSSPGPWHPPLDMPLLWQPGSRIGFLFFTKLKKRIELKSDALALENMS